MTTSSPETPGFYSIQLPFPDSSLLPHPSPLFFTAQTRHPSYQFKYYQQQGLHILDDFQAAGFLASLISQAVLLETTPERDLFPVFRLMTAQEFEACFQLVSKNPRLNNYHYTMGSIYEKRLDFIRARDHFQQGCEVKEAFSLIKMARLLIEPALSERFLIKRDLQRGLGCLIDCFLANGLFDCQSPGNESLEALYLLYVYLDCFPELELLAQKEALRNPLIRLLLMIDWRSGEAYAVMMEIEEKYSEKQLLLGDLYHPRVLGVNIETEFNRMQEKYTKTLRTDSKGWVKVACLNEAFLSQELKRLSRLRQPLPSLEDSIRRINKNIDTAYKRLESLPEYALSFEFLHYQASNSNKKALELSHLEHYRRLASLGDPNILRVFFKVLKFHYKKAEIGDRDGLAEELFLIASKIAYIDHEFREAPLAFCFEKGIGVKGSFEAAFGLYRDLLKKIILSGFEIHFFCYRFGCLLKSSPSPGLEEASGFFFQVAYWSLMSSISEEDYNGFYELGKFYLKGRGIPPNEAYALRVYELLLRNIKEKRRDSLNDQILMQLLGRKIAKIKKTGPSVIKNGSENETLKEFILTERKSSNKTIKNWPIYKTLAAGSSVSSEILSLLGSLNERFKPLAGIEDLPGRLQLPYAKPQVSVIGNLKPKELLKPPKEQTVGFDAAVPRWKSSLRNSMVGLKGEQLAGHFGDVLSKSLHFFELKNIEIDYSQAKTVAGHALFPGMLKHNKQVFSVRVVEVSESQELAAQLIEKLEVYARISCPYFLNLIGFALDSQPKGLKLLLFYEPFAEKLADFLEQQPEPAAWKYFLWIVFIAHSFQNSGYLLSYLTEQNFVVSKTMSPKLVDLDLEILNKSYKPIVSVDPARSQALFRLSGDTIPPELLYGFLKGNKSTLSSGSVAWSLGALGFWLFSRKRLFEGIEVRNYEDFKTVYNQERILQRVEANISDLEVKAVLRPLLSMNQQERTSLGLGEVWMRKGSGEGVLELPSEGHLMLTGLLHAQFQKTSPEDQEIYLPNREYFRGQCLGSLPNGTCQLNTANFSLKGDFSKGKFIGNGEIFSSQTSSVLELHSPAPDSPEQLSGTLRRLSLFDQYLLPAEVSLSGLVLTEQLFQSLISGFMTSEEAGWTGSTDLEELLKWETIEKYLKSMRNCGRSPKNRMFCIDNTLVYWTPAAENAENTISEILMLKSHYITPMFAVFDDKISSKNVFFGSFFSFGLLQLASKPVLKPSIAGLFQNTPGIRVSFPGVKEIGVFSDFELQKGVRITDFQHAESIESKKTLFLSKITDLKSKERFEGVLKNGQRCYYGVEVFSSLNKYEGGFEANRHSGKGVLSDADGKTLYKGFFKNGVPTWGLFYKEKTRKYEGVFIQIDGFSDDFKLRGSEDLTENFELQGVYLTPEEKIIASYGRLNLKDPTVELTGRFHLVYDTMNEYEGMLENGVKRGFGSYKIKRENVLHIAIRGLWEANRVRAVIYWDSGNSFEKSIGNFSFQEAGNYIMGDFGLLYFKNGNRYEGLLLDNKLQGFGEFQQNVNRLKKSYRGQFRESLRNGYGVLEDYNMDSQERLVYSGFFDKNKKNGVGVLTLNGKVLIQGLFVDNNARFGCFWVENHAVIERLCGKIVKKPGNNNEYMVEGFGIAFLKDGRTLECELSGVLEGFEGEIVGKISYPGGKKVFEGMIRGLKPNGFGEMYRNGRLVYSGEFQDGRFDGFGRLRVPSNKEIIGLFHKGLKEGFGIEIVEGKEVFKGMWKHGVKVKRGRLGTGSDRRSFGFKDGKVNEVVIEGL